MTIALKRLESILFFSEWLGHAVLLPASVAASTKWRSLCLQGCCEFTSNSHSDPFLTFAVGQRVVEDAES